MFNLADIFQKKIVTSRVVFLLFFTMFLCSSITIFFQKFFAKIAELTQPCPPRASRLQYLFLKNNKQTKTLL